MAWPHTVAVPRLMRGQKAVSKIRSSSWGLNSLCCTECFQICSMDEENLMNKELFAPRGVGCCWKTESSASKRNAGAKRTRKSGMFECLQLLGLRRRSQAESV